MTEESVISYAGEDGFLTFVRNDSCCSITGRRGGPYCVITPRLTKVSRGGIYIFISP